MKQQNLTIREKIYQMFILGLSGDSLLENPNFLNALKSNLGGAIFFTQNINSEDKFKKLVQDINQNAMSPLFLSIDQEGGRVERTLNLHNGPKYLNARESAKNGIEFVEKQTLRIAEELKLFGLNMNFAPVLDVDTNPNNPIISERSYSSNPDVVVEFGRIAAQVYLNNGIIPVGKHFPGHGETSVDSHLAMPELNLSLEELEKIHIKPFKELIKELPAVMVAHIYYSAFDKEKIPASISKNVIEGYLRSTLKFDGLVISDDMVMGGIKSFSSVEACLRGIDAGINMFIFRDSDDETIQLIDTIINKAENGEVDMKQINYSLECIKNLKASLQIS